MRIVSLASLLLIASGALLRAQDLSEYPARLTKAAADAEAASASGQADVEAVCYHRDRNRLHTAKYHVIWGPLGLRAEGTYKEHRLDEEDPGAVPPPERTFLAIFNKFEAAVWLRTGPNSVLRRYAPGQRPYSLSWLTRSVSPAWYRTRGRHPISHALAEGELPNGRGRVTSRLLDETKFEFSFVYASGASRSDRSTYDLAAGGLLCDLSVEDVAVQRCEWTRDVTGRAIPSVLRLSQGKSPPERFPEICEGFEETFRFTAVDLDYKPRDELFEPMLLKLTPGTFVDIQKPDEQRTYIEGEQNARPVPRLPKDAG